MFVILPITLFLLGPEKIHRVHHLDFQIKTVAIGNVTAVSHGSLSLIPPPSSILVLAQFQNVRTASGAQIRRQWESPSTSVAQPSLSASQGSQPIAPLVTCEGLRLYQPPSKGSDHTLLRGAVNLWLRKCPGWAPSLLPWISLTSSLSHPLMVS